MRAAILIIASIVIIFAGAYAWRASRDMGDTMIIRLPLIIDDANDSDSREGVIIGCGDRLVTVEKVVAHTDDSLTAIYRQLFAMGAIIAHEEQTYTNPIGYHSQGHMIGEQVFASLEFDRVTTDGSKATIHLTGDYVTIGTCEPPQTQAVLTGAATQFPHIDDVEILLNGKTMRFIHE